MYVKIFVLDVVTCKIKQETFAKLLLHSFCVRVYNYGASVPAQGWKN